MIESQPGSPQRTHQAPLGETPSGPPGVAAERTATSDQAAPTAWAGGDDSRAEPLGRFGHNKVGILATLFLVSGIVGLPLLLLSPAFSRPEKSFWTVAIIIYTAIVFSLFGGFLFWVWDQVGG